MEADRDYDLAALRFQDARDRAARLSSPHEGFNAVMRQYVRRRTFDPAVEAARVYAFLLHCALRLQGASARLSFPAAAFLLHYVYFWGRPPRRLDYDLEAGGQAHREEAKMFRDIFGQAYPALLATSAMSYSAFKDAPEHVKVINFGGLVIIYIVLIAGMLSRSLARRQLAFRLVSCSAVALLTFSVASQLSEPTYVVLTALVGGLLNLGIMLLGFYDQGRIHAPGNRAAARGAPNPFNSSFV